MEDDRFSDSCAERIPELCLAGHSHRIRGPVSCRQDFQASGQPHSRCDSALSLVLLRSYWGQCFSSFYSTHVLGHKMRNKMPHLYISFNTVSIVCLTGFPSLKSQIQYYSNIYTMLIFTKMQELEEMLPSSLKFLPVSTFNILILHEAFLKVNVGRKFYYKS